MARPALLALLSLLLLPLQAAAMGDDDPLLLWFKADQLEQRYHDGERAQVWEAQGWAGYDLHKLWLKTEGERAHGETEEAEVQLLYSRALTPFWDLQAGWRHDAVPKTERDWLALGIHGLAPYWFEVDAALFIGESGRSALRLEAEYELMFTQRLALVPELELNLYGKDDPARGIGSGLAETELGLRLRYAVSRRFMPYIGINYSRAYGDTADLLENAGEDTSATEWLIGVQFWF